jgi:hypothetical protein
MAVEVMAFVCPRKVLTGETCAVAVVGSGVSGRGDGSAGRIVSEKSALAVSRTREDGKNWREVTELRCDLEIFCASIELSGSGDTG